MYIQDIEKIEQILPEYDEYKIQSGDILKISILTENAATQRLLANTERNSVSQDRESLIFDGFVVDKMGYIEYPSLGKLKVSGLNILTSQKLIKEKLDSLQILNNSTVSIKILNWNVTILGEVNSPGKYYFNDPNLNILQAIGMAGDLTINGKRDDIKILRFSDESRDVISIDLTKSSFLNSSNFKVASDDIIIVHPNLNRVKSAGIIGNSGTLLTLLSFILSSIIVISN